MNLSKASARRTAVEVQRAFLRRWQGHHRGGPCVAGIAEVTARQRAAAHEIASLPVPEEDELFSPLTDFDEFCSSNFKNRD